MKHLILIGLALLSFNIFADEVKIEINPPRPVAGEVFQAYFRVFTDSDDDPVINFVPSNLEVVGKSNQGISTRTIYANGKLTVTREITIVFSFEKVLPHACEIRKCNARTGKPSNRIAMWPKLIARSVHPLVVADHRRKKDHFWPGFRFHNTSEK